jgi:TRAP-type C4-dicarboxylate transport system substrate-binding protein
MTTRTLPTLLALAALAGCGSASTDRTGKPEQGKVTVLTLANVNFQPDDVQPFADAVLKASGGHLRIRFLNDWRKGQPAAEKGVIEDVRDGKSDLGWVGARAFDWVGDRTFEPLQAPLLIDSYDAERAVLGSDVPAAVLQTLKPLGLEGIGILPGPLRKLMATKAVTTPQDLQDLEVAFSGGPGIEASLRTLGADPVRIPSGTQWSGWDATETHLQAAAGNHYQDEARYLATNLNLWPRFPVIFAGPSARSKLTSDEMAMLRRAAIGAQGPAFAAIADAERGAMTQLCRAVQVSDLSPQDLEALRAAAQPIYDSMAEDPTVAKVLEQLQALRDDTDVPASAAPKCPAKPAGTSALDGTWEGSVRIDGRLVHLRWVIAKGAYKLLELDGGRWAVGDEGKISVYRDHFEATSSGDGSTNSGHWERDGDTLKISDFGTADTDPVGVKIFAGHPWKRDAP